METTENFKQTRIGEIPIDWELKKIEDISIKVTDGTHDTPKPTKTGVPYITAIHVRDGFINFEECYYVSEEVHEQIYSRCNPEKDDLLLVNIGAGTATPARVKVDYQFSMKNVALIKHDPKKIDGGYLEAYQLFVKKKLFRRLTTGGAQPFLSLRDIKKLDIVVPKLDEQRKISTILSTWDKAIELKEKLIEQKKEQKRGIIQKLITGDVRMDGFSKEWEVKKIEELIVESKEIAPSPSLEKRLTVRLNLNGVTKRETTSIEKEGATTQYIRKAGQFIYGKQNLFKGAIGLIPKELEGYQSSSDIPAFDFKEGIEPLWFYYYFAREHFYKNLEDISSGTGSKRIQPKELYKIKLRVPSIEEQKIQAEIFIGLDKEITLIKNKLDLLKRQKQALMQQLLTGKIRVKV